MKRSDVLATAHPEFRSRLRWIPTLPCHSPLFCRLAMQLLKLQPEFRGNESIAVSYVSHGRASSKLYRPVSGGNGAALLWIHGGGYLFGHPKQDDRVCQRFVQALNITVISVHYRVATEAPFPAALEDCESAWRYLLDHAEDLQIDRDRIVVAGQSAGGGLAAALTQKLCDSGGPTPAAQVLFCPMIDDRTGTREDLDNRYFFIWNNRNNRHAWRSYLNREIAHTDVPEYAVPARRESLTGLSPAWIGTGTLDLFYDENIAYAERLREQGVECDLTVTEGATHAFESFFMDSTPAQDCWRSCYDFIGRKVCAE